MDQAEFNELAVKPETGDEMALVLRGKDPDPDRGFSMEGVEALADKFKQFVLARALAHYHRTGKMPKDVRSIVKLDWIGPEDEWLEQGPRPWFSVNDVEPDPLTPDGLHRFGKGTNPDDWELMGR